MRLLKGRGTCYLGWGLRVGRQERCRWRAGGCGGGERVQHGDQAASSTAICLTAEHQRRHGAGSMQRRAARTWSGEPLMLAPTWPLPALACTSMLLLRPAQEGRRMVARQEMSRPDTLPGGSGAACRGLAPLLRGVLPLTPRARPAPKPCCATSDSSDWPTLRAAPASQPGRGVGAQHNRTARKKCGVGTGGRGSRGTSGPWHPHGRKLVHAATSMGGMCRGQGSR